MEKNNKTNNLSVGAVGGSGTDGCFKCSRECTDGSLQCDDCKKWVHYLCSEIPIYLLIAFENTSRKYSCPNCVPKLCAKSSYEKQFKHIEIEVANQMQDEEIKQTETSGKLLTDEDIELNVGDELKNANKQRENNRKSIVTKKKADEQQYVNGGEKPQIICKFHKRQGCRRQQQCRYLHPPICKLFMKNGNEVNGCRNPRTCSYTHPVICKDSWYKGECYNRSCSFYHLIGTNRRGRNIDTRYEEDSRRREKFRILSENEKHYKGNHFNRVDLTEGYAKRAYGYGSERCSMPSGPGQFSYNAWTPHGLKENSSVEGNHFLEMMYRQMQETQDQVKTILAAMQQERRMYMNQHM